MKANAGFLITILVAFWIVSSECKISDRWKNDVPFLVLRKFDAWNRNNTCNYERMKSIPADVTWINKISLTVKIKLVRGDYDFKKAELHFEIRGLPKNKSEILRKRRYVAEVHEFGTNQTTVNLTSSPPLIFGNILELNFDITSFYKRSKKGFHNESNFNVKFQRRNRKMARILRRKNMKSFVLLYQQVQSCSFPQFITHDSRFRGVSDVFRSKNVPRSRLKSWRFIEESGKICGVNPFRINLHEIGLFWIIHPIEYEIGECSGICPIRNYETGYNFMQGQSAACQPSGFGSMTVIYSDEEDKMSVMAKFVDMSVNRCRCL